MKVFFSVISFKSNISDQPLFFESSLDFVHAIENHLSSPFCLSVCTNIDVYIFLEAFISPIINTGKDEFRGIGLCTPDVTKLRLNRRKIDRFRKSLASE